MHRNAKESPSPMFLIFPDAESLAEHVSATLVDQIAKKPEIVLGLATGGTMEPVYRRFVEQVKRQAVDLSKFRSFNLDEYVGLAADHPKSYAARSEEHTSELQSRGHLVCRLLLEKKKMKIPNMLRNKRSAN